MRIGYHICEENYIIHMLGRKYMTSNMTTGSPRKLIGKFIVPLIIGNIFQQLYNWVDTVIVGHYVGIEALAAVGACGSIMFLVFGFVMGLTTGFTVPLAQKFGAGDEEGVRKNAGNALILSLIFMTIITAVSLLTARGLLKLMNTPSDIFEYSYSYLTIIYWGILCAAFYNLMASILRAIGNSNVPLYSLVLSALLNIVLDLLFILTLGMGVAGAALATDIAQGISGFVCLIYIYKEIKMLRLHKEDFHLNGWICRNQIRIGIPMAFQFSITAIGTIIVQAVLNTMGSLVIASYTVAGKIEALATQPYSAMGMTMATYSGQNWGRHDTRRIRKGVKSSVIMSTIFSIVIAVIVYTTVPVMVRLFVDENIAQVTEYVRIYMILTTTFYVPLGLIFIFRNTLQGMGISLTPMLGGIVELVTRAVAAIIGSVYASYKIVCCANPAAWLTAAVFLVAAYLVQMKHVEEKLAVEAGREAG